LVTKVLLTCGFPFGASVSTIYMILHRDDFSEGGKWP
jgi:hypothetical protein